MTAHAEEELQQLLLSASMSTTDWAELLAPHMDVLTSREPLFAWSSRTAVTDRMHLSPMLWLLSLEVEEAEAALPTEEILHHLLQHRPCLLEQAHGIRNETRGWDMRASPLHWLLLCQCEEAQSFSRRAPSAGGLERMGLLLRWGADPNASVDWAGFPGAAHAHGHSPLWTALLLHSDLDVAGRLLQFGARFDPGADLGGLAAAMRAHDQAEVVQLFRGVHRDALQGVEHTTLHTDTDHGETPLHVLAKYRSTRDGGGALADARFLQEVLAVDIMARDAQGRTATEYASERSECNTPEWWDFVDHLRHAELRGP